MENKANTKKSLKNIFLIILSFIFISLSSTAFIAAQQKTGGSGLSVSPTRSELTIERGQSKEIEITIKNVTSGPIIARPFIIDFESDNATGEPKLFRDPSQRSSYSVEPFIQDLSDVRLKKGQSKKLHYTINIPKDAVAGGYFSALTFKAEPDNQGRPGEGEVSLTANVASLLLVEVPGNITEQIRINNVSALRDSKPGSIFLKAPNKVAVSVENNGNSFTKPFGTVVIYGGFSGDVYKYELNNTQPRGNILPKSSRVFVDDLKNVNNIGRYTVTANVSYGSGGDVIIYKSTFWYLPLWFILTSIAVLIAVIFTGKRLYNNKYRSTRRKR